MPNPLLLAFELSTGEAIGLLVAAFVAMGGALSLVYRTMVANNAQAIQTLVISHAQAIQTLITTNAQAVQSVKEDRDSWKQMANEGIENLEKAAGRYQKGSKLKKVAPLRPVVPEHSSPPTITQVSTAEIQTKRARLVAATLALDLESRAEVEAEKDDVGTPIEAAAVISAVAAKEIDKLEAKSKEKKP